LSRGFVKYFIDKEDCYCGEDNHQQGTGENHSDGGRAEHQSVYRRSSSRIRSMVENSNYNSTAESGSQKGSVIIRPPTPRSGRGVHMGFEKRWIIYDRFPEYRFGILVSNNNDADKPQ
jgi:hypothetical protein